MRHRARNSARGSDQTFQEVKRFRIAVAALTLLLLPFAAGAQFYSFGTEPSSTRWSKIETDHFKLIYPCQVDSLARVYLYNLEKYRPLVAEPFSFEAKRMPVILHPNNTMSNGSVSWAPKQINLITSPNPYSGTAEPWVEQLASHELRHVYQSAAYSEEGPFKVLKIFFGEQITGLGLGLFSPSRCLEGDAVVTETEQSLAGRGRSGEFLMYMRSLYLDGQYWGWDRMAFGSYKYKPVGNYPFGYTLITTSRMMKDSYSYYGEHTDDHARLYDIKAFFSKKAREKYPFWQAVYPVQQEYFGEMWRNDDLSRGEFTCSEPVSSRKEKLYCDYLGGVHVSDPESRFDGCVLTVKEGMEYAPSLVSIDSSGRERVLMSFPSYTSYLSDIADGKVYWSQTVVRGSASEKNYSALRQFDLRRGEVRAYPDHTKYFNPAPSPDGSCVAVAEYPVEGSSFLTLLDPVDGSVITRLEAPGKAQIVEIAFSGLRVYCTYIGETGVGVISTGFYEMLGKIPEGWRVEIPEQYQNIRRLRAYGSSLYFMSDLDGIPNIYSYSLDNGQLYRLTNSRFGANYPFIDASDKTLYYSEFDRMGYKQVRSSLDSLQWGLASFDEPAVHPDAELLMRQKERDSKIDTTDYKPLEDFFNEELYPSRHYSKLGGALKVHSWAPVYYNVDRIMAMSMDHYYDLAGLGATLYSQNETNTLTTMLGYCYHNGFHSGHAKATARILDLDVEASLDVNDRKNRIVTDSLDLDNPFIKVGVTVDYPLNLYGDGWYRMFVPLVSWTYTNDFYNNRKEGTSINKHELRYGFRYYKIRPTAPSQLYPRWGFSLSAYGKFVPGNQNTFGSLSYISAYGYIPGFTRQQGFKVSAVWQRQFCEGRPYGLSSLASLPSGYKRPNNAVKYYGGSLNYAIPVWLGDASIPGFLYLKRLQVIPFGNYAIGRDIADVRTDYWSTGTDLLLDFNIFRIGYELSAGVRYSYTGPQEGSRNRFEFLFNLSL